MGNAPGQGCPARFARNQVNGPDAEGLALASAPSMKDE